MIREEDEQQNRNFFYRSKEFQRKEVVQIAPASSFFSSLNDSYCCAGQDTGLDTADYLVAFRRC